MTACKRLTHHARQLRARQTKSESLLWNVLRAKRLSGIKFRRQHPIDPFIADFACLSRRLIIEIDGGYHDYQYEDDVSRQRYLEDKDWTVIRFANEDILADVESVAIAIAKHAGVDVFYGERKRVVSGMKMPRKRSDADGD